MSEDINELFMQKRLHWKKRCSIINFIQAFGIVFVVTFFVGCVDYKLSESIWVNASFVEKDGLQGNLVRVLHFKSIDSVDYYCLVKTDTGMVVHPFKYASGIYAQSGNPKKEANIAVKFTTIKGNPLDFRGMYHKSEVMILVSNDTLLFGCWKNKKKQ